MWSTHTKSHYYSLFCHCLLCGILLYSFNFEETQSDSAMNFRAYSSFFLTWIILFCLSSYWILLERSQPDGSFISVLNSLTIRECVLYATQYVERSWWCSIHFHLELSVIGIIPVLYNQYLRVHWILDIFQITQILVISIWYVVLLLIDIKLCQAKYGRNSISML